MNDRQLENRPCPYSFWKNMLEFRRALDGGSILAWAIVKYRPFRMNGDRRMAGF